MIALNHPDVLSTYSIVLALIESTKHDSIPFNPTIIITLLTSFENHLKSPRQF